MERSLKERFALRDNMFSTWITIPSQQIVEAVALGGLDFGVIDREHGSHSVGEVQGLATAANLRGMPVLARPKSVSASECQRLLDSGVQGLQFPGILSRQMAVRAVQMSHYAPKGSRGFSPFTRGGSYGSLHSSDVVHRANTETVVVLNIESALMHAEVSAIAELEDVDAIFIGLFDLSVSLGIPGNFSHPKLLDTVKSITETIAEKGKSVGTIVHGAEEFRLFESFGMNFFFLSVDSNVFRSAYESRLMELRNVGSE